MIDRSITIKKNRVMEMWGALNRIGKMKSSAKFSYLVAINKHKLRPEIEHLQAAVRPDKTFMVFDRKRIEINKKYGIRDEKGKHIMNPDDGSYTIDDVELWEKEIKDLRKKHQETVDNQEKRIDDYNSILDEDFTFTPTKIPFNQIPEAVDGNDMEIIFDFIDHNSVTKSVEKSH